ncbi:MAG: hypothetical protein ACRDJX_08100 [Solirubrobacteraceae bacterium]
MRARGPSRKVVAGSALALCILGVALFAFGVLRHGPGRSSLVSPVELVDGVPVGVERSQAGVLAAADSYVALASQSIEQDPPLFAALVAQAYAPEARARTLTRAQQIRASDTQNMDNYREGGRGIAVIGARRLDSYTPGAAVVTSWLGGFVWGPHLAPRQSWNLVDTRLRWQAGRWLVVSSDTDATPAPVPSIVYVNGSNDRAPAFGRLAGMTAPFYGTGG